ncbi:DUF7088 domain-containing protein, partial [Calderihabitans maritimus]
MGRSKAWQNLHTWEQGTNRLIYTLAVLGIIVLLNVLANRFTWRLDWTEGKIYTLSEQTREVLARLDREVKIIGFFRSGSEEAERFEDLLAEYNHQNPRVSYRIVDPEQNPSLAQKYGVRQFGTVVVEAGG